MARPRLEAHFVVVAASVARYATATNLLCVDYVHQVSADAEFPQRLGKLDVFTRFFHDGCRPETLSVQVWWRNPDGTDRQRVLTFFQEVPFDPGEHTRDHTFRLVNAEVPGEGMYAVRVCRLRNSRLRGVYWHPLREDYILVRRRP